jgi:hypothetical protein
MIIDITCPNCNFFRKVPREKIPEGIKFAKCPRCSSTFELPSVDDLDTETRDNEHLDFVNDIRPGNGPQISDETGYFTGLWKTLTGVLFSPRRFFSGIKREEGLGETFAFGVLLGSIGIMMSIFWHFLLNSQEITSVLETLHGLFTINSFFIACIIASPVMLVMFMLITAAVLHFFLFILRGAHRGFTGTFKVSAYSSAALIFGIVPIVGDCAGIVWWLVVMVTGLKVIHETSILRILFAFLLPFILIMIPFLLVIGFFISLVS